MTTHDQRRTHAQHARARTVLRPRGPMVLDVRELGRRAGAMTRLDTVVPAPENLASIGSQVPAGSDVHLELRLESVLEGVLVTGTATAAYESECSRCLDPVTGEVTVDLTELFVFPETDARGRVVPRETGDADDAEPEVQDDNIDLGPTVRDAVVLALPLAPVCRQTCLGLCPQCGFRLDDDPNHHHDQVDSRWAALASLLGSPHDEKEEG
ncbi:MAG TPA: YceD family protein [Candidatus Nanopelagicales bacterium]